LGGGGGAGRIAPKRGDHRGGVAGDEGGALLQCSPPGSSRRADIAECRGIRGADEVGVSERERPERVWAPGRERQERRLAAQRRRLSATRRTLLEHHVRV